MLRRSAFILAGLSFFSYFVLLQWHVFYAPGATGFTVSFRASGVYVASVVPGSLAERAGVAAGDRVVAVEGHPVAGYLHWRTVPLNARVGVARLFEFERGGATYGATIVTPERQLSVLPVSAVLGVALGVTLALAFLVARARPDDRAALIGAWFLAALSTVSAPIEPRGIAATWQALPWPIGILPWFAAFSSASVSALYFIFLACFPRPVFRSRWVWAVALAPAPLVTLPVSWWLLLTVYDPGAAMRVDLPRWGVIAGPSIAVGYLIAGCSLLALRYRTLTDANDRRRARVLLLGSALGIIGVAIVASEIVGPATGGGGLSRLGVTSRSGIAIGLILALPLSFAYAILRHRLLDIQIIVRQGLRYAAARGVVVSFVPLLGTALIVDLLAHASEPLRDILLSRGWIYGALMVAAGVAHAQRRRWLTGIDRRFFRDRYEAERVLHGIVADLRAARNLAEAGPSVAARIESALHAEFVALLAAASPGGDLVTIASSPAGAPALRIGAASRTRQFLGVLRKAAEVGHAGWLSRQLPENEVALLRERRIELLVPVASASGRDALLALGPKRSEEPYTGEDHELLAAVAGGLSMVIDRGETNGVAAPVETVLAGRYRLGGLLGRGGMGAVYEAFDTSLRRDVAVKVIREDLLANPESLERFQQEAQIAAGFAHPNVVTIHDYGVHGARAFLVMERLVGRTLREAIDLEGRLDGARASNIVGGICRAIGAAHSQRLVHRDLKPENVFVTGGAVEAVKVLDFGIAKFLPSAMMASAETGTGVVIGTLRYMAPEQLTGGRAAASWDLWALGIVAYEVITGKHPFAHVDAAGWLPALLAGRYASVPAEIPGSARWDVFFARALCPDAEGRIPSAQPFLAEFAACAADAATSDPRGS